MEGCFTSEYQCLGWVVWVSGYERRKNDLTIAFRYEIFDSVRRKSFDIGVRGYGGLPSAAIRDHVRYLAVVCKDIQHIEYLGIDSPCRSS